jgi:hypothetical protein
VESMEREPPRRQRRQALGVEPSTNVLALPRGTKRVIYTHKTLAPSAAWRFVSAKSTSLLSDARFHPGAVARYLFQCVSDLVER